MEVFVQVVERGGFSAAARVSRMTPSAVSKLVARLETRLGTRLVNRSTRKLLLTPEGRAFAPPRIKLTPDGSRRQAHIARNVREFHRNVVSPPYPWSAGSP